MRIFTLVLISLFLISCSGKKFLLPSFQSKQTIAPSPEEQTKLAEAKTAYETNNQAVALGIYDQILTKNPKQIDALEQKGIILLNQGNLSGAIGLFNEVLAQDALRWKTLNAIGVAYALNQQMSQALEYYKTALDIAPENVAVLNNLGLAYAFNLDFMNAEETLQRALGQPLTADKQRQIEQNLALVYGLSGRADLAEPILRKYMPEAAVYNNLGLYAKLAGDTDLARSYLNEALTASPGFYEKAWENLQNLPDYTPDSTRR